MDIKQGVIATLLALSAAAYAQNAHATGNLDGQPGAAREKTGASMTVFGSTLPPIGYVNFCRTHKKDCADKSMKAEKVVLTDLRWRQLVEVNTYFNKRIQPVTDQELYKVPELWTYPDNRGDCEDYVLAKKKYLISLGWSPSSLLITVVRDEKGQGHAVLTATTNLGDYILDNQHEDVLPWTATLYTYVKRQSQTQNTAWVALNKNKVRISSTAVNFEINR